MYRGCGRPRDRTKRVRPGAATGWRGAATGSECDAMGKEKRERGGSAPPGAFPGHVGLMKIHGFSIGAIKSTASLPLPCCSLRRLFSRDSFPRDRNERRAYEHQTFNLGFILTRLYDDGESSCGDRAMDIRGYYAAISCDEYDMYNK